MRLRAVLGPVLSALALASEAVAAAEADRLRCIAADLSLTDAMNGFAGSTITTGSGKTLTRGRTIGRTYHLTEEDNLQVAATARDYATGASDYARFLVYGSDTTGAPAGMTDAAGTFSALMVSCLNKFGTDPSP